MAKKKTETEFSFEQSFEELQQIVTGLEDGNLSLSQSLENYETGIKTLKECYAALNKAEQKIRELAEIDDDGNLVTKQFETAPGANKKKSVSNKSKKGAKNSPVDDELF